MHCIRRTSAEDSKPRKKHRKLKITLSIIAALLVVVLLTGWLTNWFGFYGPGAKILNAAKHTLKKGNFTISFSIDGTRRINCQVNIDWDRNDFAMLMTETDGNFICAIKDNHLITKRISFGSKPAYIAYNITGFINILFRIASGESKGINWKFILNSLSPGLYEELSKDIDFGKMDSALVKLFRKTNSDSWLKKNAGFSHSKENGADIYSFDPNTYKLATATLTCFKKAFWRSDTYDAWQENLDASRDSLQQIDYTVYLTVKEGLLTGIDICIEQRKNIGILLSQFGSTAIDASQLDTLLAEAEFKDFSFLAIIHILYAFL